MTPPLTIGIGVSDVADAPTAGTVATRAALDRLGGLRPDLLLVYGSSHYDLPALLATIADIAGDTPVVGASSSGLIHDGELTESGGGVSVLALSGGGYRYGVGCATDVAGDPLEAGRKLARDSRQAAGAEPSPYEAMLVLADALIGDPQELLSGIYRVTGFSVPVVGGAAGDDQRMEQTYVFHGDRVLAGAAVAVWIGSDHPLRVVSGHGWTPVGHPMIVTAVDGAIVRELAGRPAVAVYEKNFVDEDSDPDSRIRGAQHAFGLIQPDGSFVVRGAFIDPAGDLRTFTPLPPYAAVQVLSARADDLLEVGAQTVADAVVGDGAGVVLVFDCVARSQILAERCVEDAQRLQAAAGSVPTFGFYTYGEFARTTGVAGYHNATVAALAL